MSCWALIPVKPAGGQKSRLAGMLGPEERERLMREMLAGVIAAAQGCEGIQRVFIVGDAPGFPGDLTSLPDPGCGLNPAVASAFGMMAAQGADRVVIIHADLPDIAAADLEPLAPGDNATAIIAPDRHEAGTNVLSLPLPAARGFAFAYGPDSFALHRNEVARLGLQLEIVRRPGLARDVDEPADLPEGLTERH